MQYTLRSSNNKFDVHVENVDLKPQLIDWLLIGYDHSKEGKYAKFQACCVAVEDALNTRGTNLEVKKS